MYSKIKKMKNVVEKYSAKLIEEGVVTKEEVEDVRNKYEKICEEAYVKAQKETQIRYKDWLDSPWSGFFEGTILLKLKINQSLNILLNLFLFYRKESFKNVTNWHERRDFGSHRQTLFIYSTKCGRLRSPQGYRAHP